MTAVAPPDLEVRLPQQRPAPDAQLAGALSRLGERLADVGGAAPRLTEPGGTGRLAGLVDAFDLQPPDLDVLVVAVAPAVDLRFPPLLAAAAGEADAGWASVSAASTVLGLPVAAPELRGALTRLSRAGLLRVVDLERPLPQRRLAVDDRVVAHLLGDDDLDPALVPLQAPLVRVGLAGADRLAEALAAGSWLCWVRELPRGSGFALAADALALLGATGLALDLRQLPAGGTLLDVVHVAVREAALRGAALVVGPVDLARDRDGLAALGDAACPVVLVGPQPWTPHRSPHVPFTVDAPEATGQHRLDLWRRVLGALPETVEVPPDVALHRLTPEQVVTAATAAVVQAGDRLPTAADLAAAARAHNAGILDQLVRRVVPTASFDDLVLADRELQQVREVVDRYRTLELVRDTWRMGGAHGSRGITALFAGASGTGKTLSAEVIAQELGVDLFVIDLSQVVDKYIGETEKNLERVFTGAENVNGVLFFDEADALFGKRSDVKDAHDRHANVEVAYLLQRMERFEGVAVLATNLQTHLDEAFSRRLDVVCDFRNPGPDERRRLWQLHLPPTLPQSDDVDLDVLARTVEATGGVIRNITLSAAHAAATGGREVRMADLVAAAVADSRRRGRRMRPEDFGTTADEAGPTA